MMNFAIAIRLHNLSIIGGLLMVAAHAIWPCSSSRFRVRFGGTVNAHAWACGNPDA
jgi:hypothetical protein